MAVVVDEVVEEHDGPSAPHDGLPATSRRALVLNATFEPISVVSWRRAIVLVVGDRAEAVATDGGSVRSERLVVEVPSVVRLRRFVRIPHHRHAPLSRRAVLVRDRWTCQYCGARADGVDHVRPRSRDGEHRWENVVAACRGCNARKGDRLLSETSFRLRCRPAAPPVMSAAALALRTVPPSWRPYLPPDVPWRTR
jgi:5-methylcytosine-specific restriction endonuclease McrA